MNKKLIRGALLAAVAGVFLSGCNIQGNARYTGGGELPSSGGPGKAYVQVNADTCDGNENAKGSFTYADKGALDYEAVGGVSLTGTIAKSGICMGGADAVVEEGEFDCLCPGWPAVSGTYTSTNPNAPGSGRYYACFYSQREGAIDSTLAIRSTLVQRVVMQDGPYANYENHGTLRGTIQSQDCGI